MNLYEFDSQYYLDSALLAGIDEAGRGALAGPVVAAAVILDRKHHFKGLNDSKKLSAKIRERLFDEIRTSAIAYAIAEVSASVIDEINILNATKRAMQEAVSGLSKTPELCLIDGNQALPLLSIPQRCIVSGDSLSACIAAASILAKVFRDRLMQDFDAVYGGYHFATNKGYGTAQHLEALELLGLCPIHRQSYQPVLQRTIWT